MPEKRRTAKIHRPNNRGTKKWSLKYKRSINCRRPRGFSQKQYCAYGRTKRVLKTFLEKRRG
jgi:hypothetical protein